MNPALALHEALGEAALREHAPILVDGVALTRTLVPDDPEALGRALRWMGERELGVLVRGAGTQQALGNVPRRADAFLSTERFGGVLELDADEGVARVGAGCSLGALRDATREAGWEPPLDAPNPGSTLGGILACATRGPRVLGLREPRDAVLGLEVVLGSGERTRCGGRVVKNVTGYDLAKLYVGCLGSLGVITSAWLRLRPLPERRLTLTGVVPGWSQALGSGLAAARADSARSAALVGPGWNGRADAAEGITCVVELAGEPEVVERDARRLGQAGLAAGDAAEMDAVARSLGEASRDQARFRIQSLPSRLDAAQAELPGAALLVQPGLGLLHACFEVSGESELRAALDAAHAASRAGGGSSILEAGPAWTKQERDVFGLEDSPAAELQRGLKQRFDPAGVLNRGRFAGRL